MEWMIIIFGLIYVISLICNIVSNNKDDRFLTALVLTVSAIIFVGLYSSYENINTPTAKDVYEGKTTLEITYRDSIHVDSIDVWKENFKK